MEDTFVSVTWVADELVTSTKLNQAMANQANFHNGTAFGDGIIVTRHIGSGQVTAAKLAEAFIKGNYQSDTVNSEISDYIIQQGWGYMQGNGSNGMSETVTFPVAFSSPPVVFITGLSARAVSSGAPTSPASFDTGWSNFTGVHTEDITMSSFLAILRASAAHSSSFYFGYNWIAIGAA